MVAKGGRFPVPVLSGLTRSRSALPAPEPVGGVSDGLLRRAHWEFAYRNRLAATDALVLIATFVIAHLVRYGTGVAYADLGVVHVQYVYLAAGLASIWYVALAAVRSRDPRVFGSGAQEYQLVARASLAVFGVLAICTLLLKWDLSRLHLAVVFSVGPLGLIASRKLWRTWLHRRRTMGQFRTTVLVVGGIQSGLAMARQFRSDPRSGYRVQGIWVPDRAAEPGEMLLTNGGPIPVLGVEQTMASAIAATSADTVAVTDSEHFGPDGMRELTWELEVLSIDLLIAPNVVDVVGSRLVMRTVANRPLIHVDEPQYEGASKLGKALFDRGLAALVLLVASPLFVGVAIAIRLTSPGGVFYRQERIGFNGEPFWMMKFRSMRTGADTQLSQLLAEQGGTDSPLFKVQNDPRITRIGGFIRRFSIDELPQLVNVLKGNMSLVGPRPQVPDEVALYDERARRRLHVKPGMTGLWQVSGRSNLRWEEAVQLDLYYVENWSIMADVLILAKTVKAVVGSDGAY